MIRNSCNVRFYSTESGLCAEISGEIDHHSASGIRREIDNMIWNRCPNHLIIDMSGVEFMDSSGLGLIMGRFSLMSELGGSLSILNPSRQAMKMLTLTGFDKKLKILHRRTS